MDGFYKLSRFLLIIIVSCSMVFTGCAYQVNTEIQKKDTTLQRDKTVNFGLQTLTRPIKVPVEVKGIYVSGWSAGSTKRLNELFNLVEQTELNAMVIDIKDDDGTLSYVSQVPLANEINANIKKIDDIDALLKRAEKKNIYTIGRIVTFKDPVLAQNKPQYAVKNQNGGLWKDKKGLAWVDPYNQAVWQYNIALAKEAAQKGFKEIQFDYVRFPTDGDRNGIKYPSQNEWTKAETIQQFLQYAKKELAYYNVYISADVFGLTGSTNGDMGIGQQVADISQVVDYICPMVYPSHYNAGNFGLANPDAAPYETVYKSLQDFQIKTKETNVIIRPWLQDFSLGVAYGPQEVRAQIQAVYDLGLKEWILWNPRNVYTKGALAPGKSTE